MKIRISIGDVQALRPLKSPYCLGSLWLYGGGQRIGSDGVMVFVAMTLLLDGVRSLLLERHGSTFDFKSPNSSWSFTIIHHIGEKVEFRDIHGSVITAGDKEISSELTGAARRLMNLSVQYPWASESPVLDLQDALRGFESRVADLKSTMDAPE